MIKEEVHQAVPRPVVILLERDAGDILEAACGLSLF